MLIYLADYLSRFDSGFLVFRYITLRTILAVLTALVIHAGYNLGLFPITATGIPLGGPNGFVTAVSFFGLGFAPAGSIPMTTSSPAPATTTPPTTPRVIQSQVRSRRSGGAASPAVVVGTGAIGSGDVSPAPTLVTRSGWLPRARTPPSRVAARLNTKAVITGSMALRRACTKIIGRLRTPLARAVLT